MDYSKMPTSALLFDELPGLCRCGVDCTDSILREQILAEIDRRIPVPTAPKLDGWHPIETAPKGTAILVCRHGGPIPVIARWSPRSAEYVGIDDRMLTWQPTHWMPLPEVPR